MSGTATAPKPQIQSHPKLGNIKACSWQPRWTGWIHLLWATASTVFTNKEYNGSTIQIQGSNNNAPVTEVAVVGRTGKFWFARGYVTSKTYSLDIATQNSVVQLNVTVPVATPGILSRVFLFYFEKISSHFSLFQVFLDVSINISWNSRFDRHEVCA